MSACKSYFMESIIKTFNFIQLIPTILDVDHNEYEKTLMITPKCETEVWLHWSVYFHLKKSTTIEICGRALYDSHEQQNRGWRSRFFVFRRRTTVVRQRIRLFLAFLFIPGYHLLTSSSHIVIIFLIFYNAYPSPTSPDFVNNFFLHEVEAHGYQSHTEQ